VARAEGIVGAFVARKEATRAVSLAEFLEKPTAASGEQFVDVALVRDVEHELVARGVENAMQRDRQLDDA